MSSLLEAIENTLKEYIEISFSTTVEPSPWRSRFGGISSAPPNQTCHLSRNGFPYYFILQINFSEVPLIPPFPKKGLLQVYLADQKLCEDVNINCKALYFPNVKDLELNPKIEALPRPKHLKLEKKFSLSFLNKRMSIPVCDFGFCDTYDEIFKNEKEIKKFENYYFSNYKRLSNNRIGGYPNFWPIDSQRSNFRLNDRKVLLLQIEADTDILWGESGFASFFISEKKLENLDFSDLMVSWRQK